jgi:hypothetical protein
MGIVAERSFRGSRTRLAIQHASGQVLEFEIDDLALPAAGEPITLALRAEAISLIPAIPAATFDTADPRA